MAVTAHSHWRRYNLIDWLTQGYLLAVAFIVTLLHGTALPEWPWFVLGHVAVVLAIDGLIRWRAARPDHRAIDFLGYFYPVLLFTFLYRETGSLNHMLNPGYLDAHFLDAEQWLFGRQPSVLLMEWLPYLVVSEILYASYFSYYIMIPGVAIGLFFKDRARLPQYLTVLCFVFYVCYLIYIFTPVMGPRILEPALRTEPLPERWEQQPLPASPAAIQVGPFYQIMDFVYAHFEAPGASFPSSHVAVALCTLFFSWLYLRRIWVVHGVVVVLLCLATVYCRYHYTVDVIAGALTAAVLVPLGNWLYRRYKNVGQT